MAAVGRGQRVEAGVHGVAFRDDVAGSVEGGADQGAGFVAVRDVPPPCAPRHQPIGDLTVEQTSIAIAR